jgi:hypothetical protein
MRQKIDRRTSEVPCGFSNDEGALGVGKSIH